MNSNLTDDDSIELGIRKHSDDKLTYKLIIANAINQCRVNEGYIKAYENSVKALINLLFFDVKGYNLKSKITELMDSLDVERESKYTDEQESTERWLFYRKSYQAKFKLKLHRWYYETLFQRILQILASEGLLMDTEKLISVKTIGDEESVDE